MFGNAIPSEPVHREGLEDVPLQSKQEQYTETDGHNEYTSLFTTLDSAAQTDPVPEQSDRVVQTAQDLAITGQALTEDHMQACFSL